MWIQSYKQGPRKKYKEITNANMCKYKENILLTCSAQTQPQGLWSVQRWTLFEVSFSGQRPLQPIIDVYIEDRQV